ncbi:hypothetical protein F5882DRAFT_465034 [Hyaloscypha sp. PMI_1271]|nr:hypothetical protein F5882DRAFT_465034 [Hyaloscypha sp. PMI_1271]
MAPNAFSSYNTSELNRTISALNDTKLTLTFKLNLLRPLASSSPTHLATFDDLVDRLVDTGSQIWGLEEQNKNKESGANTGDDHEDVRKALKSAMVLVGTLDTLGEEVMRLKFALEGVEKAAVSIGKNTLKTAGAASSQGGAAGGSQSIAKAATATSLQEDIAIGASPNPADPATATHEEQRLPKSMLPLEGAQEIVGFGNNVPSPPGPRNLASVGRTSSQNIPAAASTNRQTPAAKKQKLNHASDDQSAASASEPAKVKQELAVSKQAKVPNWAPEGYYYVKAHFRRKPKRKIKQEEAEEEKEVEQPASVEIVHLDGV